MKKVVTIICLTSASILVSGCIKFDRFDYSGLGNSPIGLAVIKQTKLNKMSAPEIYRILNAAPDIPVKNPKEIANSATKLGMSCIDDDAVRYICIFSGSVILVPGNALFTSPHGTVQRYTAVVRIDKTVKINELIALDILEHK